MGMLSKQEVTKRTTLSPATIWRRTQAGDFPKPVQLTPNRIAWTEESIEEWEQSRRTGQCEMTKNLKKGKGGR